MESSESITAVSECRVVAILCPANLSLHHPPPPPALINNLSGMKVNVCNEKCITSWKPIGRTDLSVLGVSDALGKPAAVEALHEKYARLVRFTSFNFWNTGKLDELQMNTSAFLCNCLKLPHRFFCISTSGVYGTPAVPFCNFRPWLSTNQNRCFVSMFIIPGVITNSN